MSDLPAPPPEKSGSFFGPREERRPSRFGPIALFVGFLVVAAIVGTYLFGGEAPKPAPRVVEPSPVDEQPELLYVEKKSDLTDAQIERFNEVSGEFFRLMEKGDDSGAINALAVHNEEENGCFIGQEGGTFDAEGGSSAFIMGQIRFVMDNRDQYHIVIWKIRSFLTTPRVEAAYRGTYPDGEPYLKVIPRKGAFLIGMSCRVS